MKHIAIIITACLSFLMISCDDFLEADNKPGLPADDFYQTPEDVLIGLNGVYDALGDLDAYGWRMYSTGIELLNDEAQALPGKKNIFEQTQLSNASMTNSNSILTKMWAIAYEGIDRANLILYYNEKVEHSDLELKKRIEGEARFNRAYWYFILVKHWGDVPLKLEPTLSKDGKFSRTPKEEVYAQIIEDFEFGAGVENGNWNVDGGLPKVYDVANVGRATQGAAMGFLAKVYLQMAGWPLEDQTAWAKCKTWAERVMQMGQYSLLTSNFNEDKFSIDYYDPETKQFGVVEGDDAAYGSIWSYDNENSAEILFDVQFVAGNIGEGGRLGSFYGIPGTAAYGASNTHGYVLEEYAKSFDKDDTRLNWSIAKFRWKPKQSTPKKIAENNSKKWNIGKFRRPYNQDNLWTDIPLNFPLLRYADILLTYAEAVYHTNSNKEMANVAFNQVRQRAFGSKWDESLHKVDLTSLGENEATDAILDERRWELGFEGKRWGDLVRTQKLLEKIEASSNEDGKANATFPLNGLLPVPQYELDINTDWVTNGYDVAI